LLPRHFQDWLEKARGLDHIARPDKRQTRVRV